MDSSLSLFMNYLKSCVNTAMSTTVNGWRKTHLAFAEATDAWRVVPRLMVFGYAVLLYEVVHWFMKLEVPTNAQAAFVSTVVGIAAAVFGLYSSSGRKWNGITMWAKEDTSKPSDT